MLTSRKYVAVRSLLPRGGKGLEVGVGTGRFASRVGIKVGVEPAQAMASIARQRGIEVYEARAEVLPFADESFDSVLLVTTICFLKDPPQALRETRRVLKSLGHLVIGMIDENSPLGKSFEAKKRDYVLSIRTLLLCYAGDRLANAVGFWRNQNVSDHFQTLKRDDCR